MSGGAIAIGLLRGLGWNVLPRNRRMIFHPIPLYGANVLKIITDGPSWYAARTARTRNRFGRRRWLKNLI